MSKFNIEIETTKYGKVILDALKNESILFLNLANTPDEKTRTYLEEVYDNNIDGVDFGYFYLKNMRNQTEHEGWGLRQNGVVLDSFRFSTNSWRMNTFLQMCSEQTYSVRTFEPVIAISLSAKSGYGHQDTPWSLQEDAGHFRMTLEFKVYFRSEKTDREKGTFRTEGNFMYFEMPYHEKSDPFNYIKNFTPEMNHRCRHVPDASVILPYTEEKLKTLMDICRAGGNLYKELTTLLIENQLLEKSNCKLLD